MAWYLTRPLAHWRTFVPLSVFWPPILFLQRKSIEKLPNIWHKVRTTTSLGTLWTSFVRFWNWAKRYVHYNASHPPEAQERPQFVNLSRVPFCHSRGPLSFRELHSNALPDLRMSDEEGGYMRRIAGWGLISRAKEVYMKGGEEGLIIE